MIATCSQHNVAFVRSLGAEEVIAYDKTAFEEHVRDVDVVFDVLGAMFTDAAIRYSSAVE